MPTVPRATRPTETLNPLPVTEHRAVSPEAFGAGLGQGIATLGVGIARYAEEEQKNADAARLTVAWKDTDTAEHDVVYDPVNGALTEQGRNALGVYDRGLTAFDKRTATIREGLANDRQRKVFDVMAARRREQIGGTLQSHELQQVTKADNEDTQAAVDSTVAIAGAHFNDPARIEEDMKRGEGLILSYAKRTGAGKDTTDQQLATFRSALHAGVIERALAGDHAEYAKEYFDKHSGEIVGKERDRLEIAVNKGTELAEAFKHADAINSTAPDRESALEQVRQIKDPEVRQRTQTEVNQFWNEKKAAEAEAENKLFEGASDQLDKLRTIPRLQRAMGADWLKLDHNSKVALEAMARSFAAGPSTGADAEAWTTHMLMSPEQLVKVNPLKDLKPYLTPEHYNAALEDIKQARAAVLKGDSAAIGKLGSVVTTRQQVTDFAKQQKIIPSDETDTKKWTDEQRDTYGQLQTTASRAIEAFQTANKREATGQEKQEILDEVWMQETRVKGTIKGWTPTGWLDWIAPDEVKKAGFALLTDQQGRVYAPYDNIPVERRSVMEARLRAAGYSEANLKDAVQRLAAAGMTGDLKAAEAILSGGR